MKPLLLPSKKYGLLLAVLCSFIFQACKVTMVAGYDATLYEQAAATAKTIDRFYLMMLETTKGDNGTRNYEHFVAQYVDIEVDINSIVIKNRMKPLNRNSARISEIALQLWQKYKEEHKQKRTISDGLVKLNRKTFDDVFNAMLIAEKAKDMLNNPPQ